MAIRVLSPDLSMKIAAGEVVERPSSVVKELVENALDAGARKIDVEVREGGIQLLRVTDNGHGIPADELVLAFERHATSKIALPADLGRIGTLGFRGEALAAIAAVSSVTLISRTREQESGHFIQIKNGVVVEQGARGCPLGTSVTVRNLFSSVPARRKYLKSESAEAGQISNVVTQYSLAYPEVKFTLLVNGRLAFQSTGGGDLRDVLVKIYGVAAGDSVLPLLARRGLQPDGVEVAGCLGLPTFTRSSRSHISIFVNRRWVASRALSFAVEEAYGGMLPEGRHPIVVLDIRLPLDAVDPNVHPAKTEIRLLNEREVFRAVRNAVHDTLVEWSPIPEIGIQPQSAVPTWDSMTTQSVFDAGGWNARPGTIISGNSTDSLEMPVERKNSRIPFLRILGQVASTYIVTEGPEGIYLIDQHTAHERVLYERIKSHLLDNQVEQQGLLSPEMVDLTPQQNEVLGSRLADLESSGFVIEPFGERTYLVRAVPALLAGKNVLDSLTGIIDDLVEGKDSEDWQDRLSMSLACHAAIRAGQTLSIEVMRELVEQLEATVTPATCPHGRPTMIHLSASQLEKEFGRR